MLSGICFSINAVVFELQRQAEIAENGVSVFSSRTCNRLPDAKTS